MIVLIGSQKGGCGKSTTAVNISAYLASKGSDVVLVDADPQGTSANWSADRSQQKSEITTVNCVQKYDNIRNTLIDLDKRYEFVIVDAAGRDSRELRTGMTAAHIMIVPFRPSQPDLDTMPHLQTIITQAKDLNDNLNVFGLITMAPTNPVVSEINEAKEYLSDYPDIKLLKTVICSRKIYRDSMSEGLGVCEMSNEKAKLEIQSLIKEIF